VPALQAQNPEFKTQSHKNKKERIKKKRLQILCTFGIRQKFSNYKHIYRMPGLTLVCKAEETVAPTVCDIIM
jgi:hypothetical protein